MTWSITSGTGTVNSAGLYTAPRTSGTATIRATAGSGMFGSATVSITYEEIAWYQFDTSSASLTDSSGHGKTATMTGTLNTNYNFTSALEGTGLHLVTAGSPATEYATLPTGIVSTLTDFTISFWAKADTLNQWSRVFDFGTGTTAYMFFTMNPGGTNQPRFAITTTGNGGELQLNDPTAVTTGVWYHFAITVQGTTANMYVNGTSVSSTTAMTIHPADLGSTTHNYLGKSQFGDAGFQGSIDDFRIFSRALTAAQVSALSHPLVVNAAAASASPVTTASTTLSLLGSDITAGESNLTYTWATLGTPPAAVNFSINGTNAAKTTTATFTKAGNYTFQGTIVNPAAGATFALTSTVVVTVSLAANSITVNPSSPRAQ